MKQIVVTGASRGIGRYLAEQTLASGYQVVGIARTIPQDCPFQIVACDVRNPEEVKAALSRFKDVYALINAAGVLRTKILIQSSIEDIQDTIATNLLGTICCCKSVVRPLLRGGGGRIINFSSIAAHLALQGDTVYSATKAGVEAFSRALARELAERSVTVNCIAPGPVQTDMIRDLKPEQIDQLVRSQIIAKQATVEDLWRIVRFLLSDDSAMITGQVMHVGGY
jgi:3-oxoacyl-[acyl-carrier protein] reductase